MTTSNSRLIQKFPVPFDQPTTYRKVYTLRYKKDPRSQKKISIECMLNGVRLDTICLIPNLHTQRKKEKKNRNRSTINEKVHSEKKKKIEKYVEVLHVNTDAFRVSTPIVLLSFSK